LIVAEHPTALSKLTVKLGIDISATGPRWCTRSGPRRAWSATATATAAPAGLVKA